MIKAVLFDAGGVLLDLNLDACRQAFKTCLGYDRIDELLDPCHQKGIYGDMEEGKITAEEFVAAVLSESREGSTPEMVDHCMAALLQGIQPYKAEYVKALAERGYALYLLSNNNEISWTHFQSIFRNAGIPIEETFVKSFLSCRIGALKPSPAIFMHVLDSLGLKPEEILFIDDSASNAAAAADLGFKSLHYIIGTDLAALVDSALSADGD